LLGQCLAMNLVSQSTQLSPQEKYQHVIDLSQCGPHPLDLIQRDSSSGLATDASDCDETTVPLIQPICASKNLVANSYQTSIEIEGPPVEKGSEKGSIEEIRLPSSPIPVRLNGETSLPNQHNDRGKEIALHTSKPKKFEECPICLTETRADAIVPCKGCNKVYHIWCIEDWKEVKTTCPTCRSSLLSRIEELTYFIYMKIFCQSPLISLTTWTILIWSLYSITKMFFHS
ncbi:hypothetical protein MJO29_000735, partial [Puccinia striiformis f. sp. tritici]